jgi:TatD DNase family protein
MSGLIDTHCHLLSRQFSEDLEAVLDRALAAGVTAMVAPAVDLENSREILALCDRHADVFAAIGVHPCDVDSVTGDAWVDELRELARHPKVVALGETGLDFFHAPPEGWTVDSWRGWQAEVLTRHLELAEQLGLPVVLHNRESWQALTELVLPWSDRIRAQFHCFTGTAEDAAPVLRAGHLVSFTGIVTFKNPGHTAAAAAALPEHGFMLETDAPYLAPMPDRGKRCEPAHVARTAAKIAQLRGVTNDELARLTSANARAFFGWRLP